MGQSTLQSWCDRCRALGFDAHEDAERDGHVRRITGIRKTLLPKTIVEASLKTPHLAARHAVRRPRRKADAIARVVREVRQVLQPDALAIGAVTRRARKVVRPGAVVED